jgi:hypothetical protein
VIETKQKKRQKTKNPLNMAFLKTGIPWLEDWLHW